MRLERLLIFLTLTNMALLMLSLAQFRTTVAAQDGASVLRGRALQIVDGQGRVRASITVLPASTPKNGESYPETPERRVDPRRAHGHEGDLRPTGGERHRQFIEIEERGRPGAGRQAVAWTPPSPQRDQSARASGRLADTDPAPAQRPD